MSAWYYSRNGERQGPVSFEALKTLARSGGIHPVTDLAWTEGMRDWQPSGQVAGLFTEAAPVPGDAFNPYAAPLTSPDDLLAPVIPGNLRHVEPGSVQFDIVACLKRGMDLTRRHFGKILLLGVIYLLTGWAMSLGQNLLIRLFTGASPAPGGPFFSGESIGTILVVVLISLVHSAVSIFLAAGLTRAALNISSGHPAEVPSLFGEGKKMLSLIGASFLFYLMFAVGLLLLIVPGIYAGLRFGFFMSAIVDRNLGPVAALEYSARLTKNNALNVFGLWIMCGLTILAGALALLVGLVFAIPVITLAFALAYRYLQFSHVALLDHPGTTVPIIKDATTADA